MTDQLPDAVLDYQLETRLIGSRYVTHAVQDPDQPPSAPPQIEKWKSDRRPIGSGGQGQVFKQTCVHGARLNDFRAVKTIADNRLAGNSRQQRFARELETMVRFSHQKYAKHFVRMLGWYFTDENLCIAMEYLPKGDLQTYLHTNQSLSEVETQQIISQVVQGLTIMHNGGFAHRDIKPQNVLIHASGTVDSPTSWWIKLADFGISKRTDASAITTCGPVGTLDFMAPEILDQIEGDQEVDYKATDIWSLGVMAFYITTKLPGFRRRRKELENLSPDKNISSAALDFILKLTLHRPHERLRVDAVASHEWLYLHMPQTSILSALQDEAIGNDDSSISSSSYNSIDAEQEIMTLATRQTDTVWGDLPKRPIQYEATPEATMIEGRSTQADLTTIGMEAERSTLSTEFRQTSFEEPIKLRNDTAASVHFAEATMASTEGLITQMDGKTESPIDTHSSEESMRMKEHIRMLIDTEANLEAHLSNGCTPLVAAAYWGDAELAKMLLARGASTETTSKPCLELEMRLGYDFEFVTSFEGLISDGVTPLLAAASRGSLTIVKDLLDQGAQVQATSIINNVTSLHWATRIGNRPIVAHLLSAGARLEARSRFGATPLYIAAVNGQEETVRLLVAQGADMETKNFDRATPLLGAVVFGRVAIIEQLVRLGANLEAATVSGLTSLLAAAELGHTQAVQCLILLGADVYAVDNYGQSAAALAAANGHLEVLTLLAGKGLDITTSRHEDFISSKTPLYLSVTRGCPDVLRMLLKKGADAITPDEAGRTFLELAISAGKFDIVKILVYAGAKVDRSISISKHDTQTRHTMFASDFEEQFVMTSWPLNLAVQKGSLEMVIFLADQGASVSLPDSLGRRPVHWAAIGGSLQMVEFLVQRGALKYPVRKDPLGSTPLHWAAAGGSLEVSRYLVRNGVNPLSRDARGDVPFTVAGDHGHTELAELLNDLQTRRVMHEKYFVDLVVGCDLFPYKEMTWRLVNRTARTSFHQYFCSYSDWSQKRLALSQCDDTTDEMSLYSWILHNGDNTKQRALAAGKDLADSRGTRLPSLDSLIYVADKRPSRRGAQLCVVLRAALAEDQRKVIFRYMLDREQLSSSPSDGVRTRYEYEWRTGPVALRQREKWSVVMSLYRLEESNTGELDAVAPDTGADRRLSSGQLASLKINGEGYQSINQSFEFTPIKLWTRSRTVNLDTDDNLWGTHETVSAFSTAVTIWSKITSGLISTASLRKLLGYDPSTGAENIAASVD